LTERKKDDKRVKSAPQRRMEIIEAAFGTVGRVRTRDLAERFGIGQNLLANDVGQLVEMGLIERGHGWIARKTTNLNEVFSGTEFSSRQSRAAEEKQAIARFVARRLPEGTQAILDAGSTSLAIGERLARSDKSVEIITNNLPLTLLLAKHSSLSCHVVGGHYAREQAATTGDDAARMIEGRKADAAVITPRAMTLLDTQVARSPQRPSGSAVESKIRQLPNDMSTPPVEAAQSSFCLGLYAADPSQHAFKSTMIKNAAHLFICLDPSKFLVSGLCFFTIIVSGWLSQQPGPGFWRESGQEQDPKRLLLQPVRTRGPVSAWRTERGNGVLPRAQDAEDPVDLREPESLSVVTTTEEGGYPPAELVRQLRILKGEPLFEELIDIARDVFVVVDPGGEPIPKGWIERYVLG